ncbi:hypothetical protein MUP01_00660 [Candidatus Bathyarchaeota archaeon]|nr:hypothetical protein [Candidatus Bathyarchaeota archaeon]
MPETKEKKLCPTCGRVIKQKYFKKCIHCRQADKRAKRRAKELTKAVKEAIG